MHRSGPAAPIVIGLAAVFSALASACATHAPSAAPTGSPAPPVPRGSASAGGHLVVADAGLYMAFRAPTASSSGDRAQLPTYQAGLLTMRRLLGVDLQDSDTNDILGVDPDRPVVVSHAIVNQTRLAEVLADPEPPSDDAPFVVRYFAVVPVADPARAQAALGQVMDAQNCARPRADAAGWAAWLAPLSPADRRAAEASDAAYLCLTDFAAIVVRADVARRELSWMLSGGTGDLLASASEKPAPDAALSARLQAEGFFSARRALFILPMNDVRAATATGLFKLRAGLTGIDKAHRGPLWRQGVHEIGGLQRLIDSPPLLLSGMLFADEVFTWTLTSEGRTFFASLGIGTGTSVASFKASVATRLKPAGAFSDPIKLDRTQHEAGTMARMLVFHTLWPHAIAFAAAHPGAGPTFMTYFEHDVGRIELDVDRSQLRLRRAAE